MSTTLPPRSLLLLLALGCGGMTPPASESANTTTGPERPWADMTFDERRRYMAERVLPTMTELFTAYDAERYADFSCATCHGDDARAVGYHMPNHLPGLWPSGTREQRAMVQQQPEMARFMFSRVLPTMTELLGQPAWNNEDKTGFSCFNCHRHGESTSEPTP